MNEQEIMDNAPEGWTHVETTYRKPLYSLYKKSHGIWFMWIDGKWIHNDDYIDSQSYIRARSDIERIAELYEITEAVAHIGVDYGYGEFYITDDLIEKARNIIVEYQTDDI